MATRVILDFRGPQPGAGVALKQVSAGDRQLSIVTNTPSHSDAVVQSLDALPGPGQTAHTATIASRNGAMYMDKNNPLYGNRPLIEVLELGSSATAAPKKSFDNMILTNVQEQDSEKTDVHETFGTPYFFASGRFTRRFTFSGVVRAAPVNYESSDPNYKITQYVLMRQFYESYMRISVQALKGWFTRITVNKEVYEGFVSTMNFTTDSQQEHFVPFVFTVFGTARRNDMLDPVAQSLLGVNASSVANNQATAKAKAEVLDAIPRSKAIALPNTADLGTLNHNNPVPSGAARVLINIRFDPRPEILTVRGDLPGIEPVYNGTKKPLNGSLPSSQGPIPIDFVVTDYWLLFNTILARVAAARLLTSVGTVQALPPGQTALLPGIANFSIITASQNVVKVAVRFHLTPPANVIVGRVIGYVQTQQVGDGSIIPPGVNNTEIVLGSVKAADAYDGSNAIALQLRYFLTTPDGSPVPPDALNGATVVYDVQDVYPALGEALIPVNNAGDKAICKASVALNNVLTPVPEEVSVHNQMVIQLNSVDLMASVNPFSEADRVVIAMRPTIFLKGYPAVKLPTFLLSVLSGAAATRSSLKALYFIGAEWKPVQTQVASQERLDQFGLLKFSITTTDSLDVAKSVYAALKRGSLEFQTRFASQEPQSSARIGPVPLNGTSYGTGELYDPVSGVRVYLRNRLASLTFSPSLRSLVLIVEVNTTFQSGFAAYLYSARFWSYISDVISAHLVLPSSVAIEPPNSWVK